MDGKSFFSKKEIPNIGLDSVNMTRHHLYPKNRKDVDIKKEKYILKLWAHRHFFGWNRLFHFDYIENRKMIHSELTIDEIIYCMVTRHSFIMDKIGSIPWKLIFGNKNIEDAIDLLCRMLSIKFRKEPIFILNSKIDLAIKIAA